MSQNSAFMYPPSLGNGEALLIYFAIFLVPQTLLAIKYLRGWNWLFFWGIFGFLTLEALGSIAYIKLHFTPVVGGWYSVWLIASTTGPTFFIFSLHLCIQRIIVTAKLVPSSRPWKRPTPGQYTHVCFSIDCLSLIFQIIGGVYAGAHASSQVGFNLMIAAMAVQLCSLVILLAVASEIVFAVVVQGRRDKPLEAAERSVGTEVADMTCRRSKSFKAFLITFLLTVLIIVARTVVRAIDMTGGLAGPLRVPGLVNDESILLALAILAMTAFHPGPVFLAVSLDMENPTQVFGNRGLGTQAIHSV